MHSTSQPDTSYYGSYISPPASLAVPQQYYSMMQQPVSSNRYSEQPSLSNGYDSMMSTGLARPMKLESMDGSMSQAFSNGLPHPHVMHPNHYPHSHVSLASFRSS